MKIIREELKYMEEQDRQLIRSNLCSRGKIELEQKRSCQTVARSTQEAEHNVGIKIIKKKKTLAKLEPRLLQKHMSKYGTETVCVCVCVRARARACVHARAGAHVFTLKGREKFLWVLETS